MKKAIKISAVLVALVVLAAMAFVFTSSAAEVTCNTIDDVKSNLALEDTTVKLGADIGSDTDVTVFNVAGKVVLDLNGHKITSGSTGSLFVQEGVTNPVEFVITDSVGGGAIIAPNATLFENFGATVKIEGGTIVAAKIVNDAEGKKVPVVTIAQSKAYKTGTWTSFDPTSCLVLGYAATANSASTVDAAATYYVAPAIYKITYTVPEGANNPNATTHPTYTIWDTVSFEPATADGYEFKGWYLKENGAESPIEGLVSGSNFYNIEVVGKFEPKVYNITYAGEGYTNNESNPATFTVTMPAIKLGDASKVGYKFLGWYTEADGKGTRVTQIECNTTFADVTVYPHFEVINYNITYVTYGGTPVPTKTTYTVEDEFDFELVSKPGYNFLGWYANAIPTDDDAAITGVKKGTIGDITVYAQYETKTYTITYGEDDKITTDYSTFVKEFTVETPTFFLPVPEVETGYSFVGWQDSTGAIITAIPVGTVTDIELVPVIKTTIYKIFYVFGTGIVDSDVNNDINASTWYEFTITDAPALVAPSRAHYTFLGWAYADPFGVEDLDKFLEENALDYDETTKTWNIPEGTSSNVYVYAVWEATEYSINYDADGYAYKILVDKDGKPVLDDLGNVQYVDADGNVTTEKDKMVQVDFDDDKAVLTEDAPVAYTYFADVTIPTPTREGYKFVRWYDKNTKTYLTPDANGVITIEDGTRSGDLDLVAEWEITKYKVTVKYQFNDDYYGVNVETLKTNPAYIDDGRTFFVAVENVEVVYGTPFAHEVNFKALNGFVPEMWNLEVIMGAEDTTYIIYFEPVIRSTVFEDGKLIITYHDNTKKEIAINAVTGVKYDGGKLVYVDASGTETPVAYATSAQFATLETTVNTINDALNALKTQVETNKTDIATLKAALVDLAKINENADAIANLKTSVTDLQAQVDALAGKNGTYLVLIIIVAVIAVAAAAGVVVLFVKKK